MAASRSFRLRPFVLLSGGVILLGLCQLGNGCGKSKQSQEGILLTQPQPAKGAAENTSSGQSSEPVNRPATPTGGNVASSGSAQEKTRTDQASSSTQTDNTLPHWVRVAQALGILFSWPALIGGLVILYFVLSKAAPYKLARVLKPFRSLKLFGAEFVLSEEVGADAEQAIQLYRRQVKRQFDTLLEIYDVRAKLEAVVEQVLKIVDGRKKVRDTRCTLHVPDILFAHTLYQLVDYYPRGGGRGRTFSSRFGIIGLCWRSREDEIRGAVPTDASELVRQWGMTREEAAASGDGRQSFLVVLLRDSTDTPLAIFYMDSKEPNAFGADNADEKFKNELKTKTASVSKEKGLIASLEKMRDALKDRRPAIRIHEQ